jgi:hypothetical protein
MSIEPSNELSRRMAPVEILTRDTHATVGWCTGRKADLMVVPPKVVQRYVHAYIYIAEESEVHVGRGAVKDPRHVLDFLMIGRNTESD